MRAKDKKKHGKSKRKLLRRLENRPHVRETPMMEAKNIHYEIGDKAEAIHCGGIGAMHLLATHSGLIRRIDEHLNVLKRHLPYHESDHVLTMAYNIVAGGQCVEDIELLRRKPAFMDALGAVRIPDPTTSGDFLRRFDAVDVERFMDTVNGVRQKIWKMQGKTFRREAIIQVDATVQESCGECKEGMDIAYNGKWGYAPLIVSLANSREPLFIVNRPGNTPSCADAARWIDKAIEATRPVFGRLWIRGDSDYALTENFDRWTEGGVCFAFGYDARKNLIAIAEQIVDWSPLVRPAAYEVRTSPRAKPDNVKEKIVRERGYKNLVLEKEEIAEFSYRPVKCKRDYRVVAVRKTIKVLKGQLRMEDDVRYFFYITNADASDRNAPEVVFFCNDRCDHENDIEQLRNGIYALKMPAGDLVANWAYMAIVSLAWTLKAWMGLLMPHRATGRWIVRMEFRRFLATFINIPAQVVRTGRRFLYRLAGYMEHAPAFFGFLKLCRTLRL